MSNIPDPRYFAFTDAEDIVPVGRHLSFGEADDVSPPTTVWLFTEDALRTLQRRIEMALNAPEEPA